MFGFRVIYLTLRGGFCGQNAAGLPGEKPARRQATRPKPEPRVPNPESRTPSQLPRTRPAASNNPNNCSCEGGPEELSHLVAAAKYRQAAGPNPNNLASSAAGSPEPEQKKPPHKAGAKSGRKAR